MNGRSVSIFLVTVIFGLLSFVAIAYYGYQAGQKESTSTTFQDGSPSAQAKGSENSTTPQSDGEPDSFMGLRFGQDIRSQILECPPDWYNTSTLCRREIAAGLHEVLNVRVGDRIFGSVMANQISGQMENVMISFSSDRFNEIMEMLTARYGKPTEKSVQPWRSKAGATFNNNTASWRWRNLHISVDERGNKVDEGFLFYSTAAWRASKESERNKTIKDAAKNL
jgi:hypothetical protein